MATRTVQRSINAVVVSAGLMQKTVKVRIGTKDWNSHIRKHFNRTTNLLVHDPRSSLRIGDVIAIEPGWRVSKHVRHVVSKIIAPFGEPVEARPAVPSFEERWGEKERRRAEKDKRREARRRGGFAEVEKEKGEDGREDYGNNTAMGEAKLAEIACEKEF